MHRPNRGATIFCPKHNNVAEKPECSLRIILNVFPHVRDVSYRFAQLGCNGFPGVPGAVVCFQEAKFLLFFESPCRSGTRRAWWRFLHSALPFGWCLRCSLRFGSLGRSLVLVGKSASVRYFSGIRGGDMCMRFRKH